MENVPSVAELLNRIKRLEAALRQLRAMQSAPALAMPFWLEVDAVLADTSPSCCEEVRRATLEEAAKHVEAHSCVSSCCDAQPSAGEAAALAACIRALSNQAPPKSHIVHRVIEEGLAPACKTEGATRTTTDEAEVTCRRCLVLFGWIPPARRDEHALDEAKTARAGQCSCSVGSCVHQKIRETFESPLKSPTPDAVRRAALAEAIAAISAAFELDEDLTPQEVLEKLMDVSPKPQANGCSAKGES